MVFTKWFRRKSAHDYFTEGERLLQADRLADARLACEDALAAVRSGAEPDPALEAKVLEKLVDIGNRLAALNLTEADHALVAGNVDKAREHAELALTQAEDVGIRQKAEQFMRALEGSPDRTPAPSPAHGCEGCKPATVEAQDNGSAADFLTVEERFLLMVQALPGELSDRYRSLGEKFAYTYVAIHEGNEVAAIPVLQELAAREDNDIFLYELALVRHRQGDIRESERLLRRTVELNPGNTLASLAFVQLLCEMERQSDAVVHLERLLAEDRIPEQAHLILGDIAANQGDASRALEEYTAAMAYPSAARAAAERLIPLLEEQGRSREAEFLYKKYCGSCR